MKEITIDVLQEDIDIGKYGDCNACPIANAFKRIFKGNLIYVAINFYIRLDFIDNKYCRFETPSKCLSFMEYYDNFKRGFPFSFKLELQDYQYDIFDKFLIK